MYSSVRRFAIFSFILAVVNAVGMVLLMFYFADMHFAAKFSWILYTVTSTLGLIFLSWALFNLSTTLEREYSSNSEYLHKLNKRIKALEDRTN